MSCAVGELCSVCSEARTQVSPVAVGMQVQVQEIRNYEHECILCMLKRHWPRVCSHGQQAQGRFDGYFGHFLALRVC